MSLDVLLLVLASACAHAGWNFLAKGAEGGAAFVWLATVAATVLYAPTLATGITLDRGATVLMAGSGALHALYFVLLQRGYASGDLSLVYPLARGTGPLLSTALAIAVLGERPGIVALVGAALIVTAVLSLGARPGGSSSSEATLFALLTGVTIAAYTLWDKQAVDEHELSPITYFWGTNAVNALLLTPFALRSRTRLSRAWTTSLGRAAGVGLLSPLAYVLVLFALAEAPVSYVAPARETSILLATLLGVTVLGEGDGRRRAIAAAGIVAGITALAVG